MRSKQYFTSIKNNPHEISTDPFFYEQTDVFNIVFFSFKFVILKELIIFANRSIVRQKFAKPKRLWQ